jgi:3-dehydroquinate synthetase
MRQEQAARVESVIRSIGSLPSMAGLKLKVIMEALQHDKKVRDGAVHFVLPLEIGRVEITNAVPLELVRETVKVLIDENKVRR